MKLIINADANNTVNTFFEVSLTEKKKVTIGTAIVQPGERLPATGTTSHVQDEYGYIINGEIVTYSGGQEYLVTKGTGTFIPKGEEHWCRNDTDEPIEIVWVFVE